jgi:hypothetical protein
VGSAINYGYLHWKFDSLWWVYDLRGMFDWVFTHSQLLVAYDEFVYFSNNCAALKVPKYECEIKIVFFCMRGKVNIVKVAFYSNVWEGGIEIVR